MADTMETREWRRTIAGCSYLTSTSRSLLQHDFIQKAFANPAMYWAKSMSPANLSLMVDNSCTLGLYRQQEEPQQIGMARIVTDYVTFAWLTDVYIEESHQGLGLGKWLIACCREVLTAIPELRRAMLLTGSEVGIRFYEREMGMEVFEPGRTALRAMGVGKADMLVVDQTAKKETEIKSPDAST